MKKQFSATTPMLIIAQPVVDFFVFLRVIFKKHVLIFFLSLILFTPWVKGQSNPFKFIGVVPNKYSIGLRSGFGFVIPHRYSMIHLITGHAVSSELYLETNNGTKKWHQVYNYPTYGVGLYYAYLGNPSVLGNALALDFYSNLHMVKRKQFLFDLRLASGIGYLTKTFDAENNNQDIAIGSNLNISVGISLDFKWKVKYNWQLGAAVSIKHFSNGAFTMPNLGINVPMLLVTAKKYLRDSRYILEYVKVDTSQILKLKMDHTPNWSYLGIVGLGAREISPPGGKKMGVYSLELNARWQPTIKSAYLAGVDVIHNVALYNTIKDDSTFTGTVKDITQYCLTIGYAQQFSQFELFFVNGYYLHSVTDINGSFYQRVGGRYFFRKNFTAQFAIKTHLSKADYFEIGLGYLVKPKTNPRPRKK